MKLIEFLNLINFELMVVLEFMDYTTKIIFQMGTNDDLSDFFTKDVLESSIEYVDVQDENTISLLCKLFNRPESNKQNSDVCEDICKQNAIVGDSKPICGDCQMYNGEKCLYLEADIAEDAEACDQFKPCKGFNGHTCEDCYKYDKYHYWCKYDKHHVDETTPACKNFTPC